MIRMTIGLLIALAVVGAAAIWFSENPGDVSIQWQGWLIEMSVGRFALAALIAIVAVMLVLAILRAIWRAPGRFAESLRMSRRERGYRALTQGMVAVAAGDPGEAQRQARRADVLLNEPPLTMLLSAQAAQLDGDEAAARRYFTSMLDRPETAFLGLRGLLMQAQREGDRPAALEYAERAYRLQPKTPWVLVTMFELQVREGRWRDALATLEDAVKRRALSPDEARDRRAAVLLGCSSEAEAGGDVSEALRFARRANTLAPDFLPATLRTVDLMVRNGKSRAASRMIHNAWARSPHPDLARIYGDIGDERDPLKRVRRFERLLSFNADHPESHIALAEAALAAELWGEARNHLEKAAGGDPSARVCRLMADLEEREHGNTDASRTWLLRASAATPDPAWVCGECGAAWERWSPLCGSCEALGTQHWQAPARARKLGLHIIGATPGAGMEGGAEIEPPPPAERETDGDRPVPVDVTDEAADEAGADGVRQSGDGTPANGDAGSRGAGSRPSEKSPS